MLTLRLKHLIRWASRLVVIGITSVRLNKFLIQKTTKVERVLQLAMDHDLVTCLPKHRNILVTLPGLVCH